MKQRSLRLFKKKRGTHLNPEQWIGVSLTIGLFFIGYLEHSFGNDFNGWGTNFAIVWFIYIIGLMVVNFFRYESEFGEYTGELIFWNDRVQIDQKSYSLSEIKILDFVQVEDIRGRFMNSMLEFTPHLSNGLDNLLIVKLKSGEELRCVFQQTETERLKHFEEVLAHYYRTGIITWLQLLDLLDITDYEKIQVFKKKVSE